MSVSRRPWEIPVLLIKCGSRQKRYTTLCFGHPSCLLTDSLCELMLISKSLFIIRLFLPKARVIVVHCRCLPGISDILSFALEIQAVNVPEWTSRNNLVCLVFYASLGFVMVTCRSRGRTKPTPWTPSSSLRGRQNQVRGLPGGHTQNLQNCESDTVSRLI